jgi:hypothetical protein
MEAWLRARVVRLREQHPGIPDSAILEQLLKPDDLLVTADRVLHARALSRLLVGVERLTLKPCRKGPFFDSMTRMLRALNRGQSNEVRTVDYYGLCEGMLERLEALGGCG